MTWKFEIYRALFVVFGTTQTILNLSHLLKKNGLKNARKQHGELPGMATQKQLRTKVICMLMFGILILLTGLYSYFTRSTRELEFTIVLAIYTAYAFIEALYYRYWKTTGAFLLPVIVLVIFIL